MPENVFKGVTMDLITKITVTDHGYDAIATFARCLSRYTYFVPCKGSITAMKLANLFFLVFLLATGCQRRSYHIEV